ncbi:MAG TPA: thioesterase family protein [Rhodospirillaceae bacterium]|nr:thioesterase family protein [Rhodospirillaceae bacterium]
MNKRIATPSQVDFEPEFIAGLTEIFEEKVVFNKLLGVKVTSIRGDGVACRIDMRPELIGHFAYNRLHGGVISAALDSTGGLAVMAAIGARHMSDEPMQRLHRFAKLGTIDLRVDYLAAGIGEYFLLRGDILRLGSRVATARMEFLDGDQRLLAYGVGTYIVS